jgi:hypothetical protein
MIEKGQGFFVPALDLEAAREAGLRAAVPYKIKDAQAMYALHQGKIGVLFYRRAPTVSGPESRRRREDTSGQSAPAEHPDA